MHAPGFALAEVLTLMLGIGAATAIFSVVHAVVVSPLPYPESDQLVRITHAAPGAGVVVGWVAALIVTGWMKNLLLDVPATDFEIPRKRSALSESLAESSWGPGTE